MPDWVWEGVMGKRLQGLIAGVIAGVLIAGGVAYAVTVVPPNSSDRYYACVRTNGVIRPDTLRLNKVPTSCPGSTDTVRSWNAQGPRGLAGATGTPGANGTTGATGATGPSGAAIDCAATPRPGINLSGCDLSGRNLTGANLTGANLAGANLTDADLSSGILTGANLAGANLTNADLSGLRPMDLTGANLAGANLSGADFQGASFVGANLALATGGRTASVLIANFSGVDLRHVDFAYFYGGPGLVGANLSGKHLENVEFREVDLSNADLSGATLKSVSSYDIDLRNADLSNATLDSVSLYSANYMTTANLTGVTWINVTCPDASNSNTNGSTCVGHLSQPA
jgi:uncharacterized protein YjbI with pentapeptide repeats